MWHVGALTLVSCYQSNLEKVTTIWPCSRTAFEAAFHYCLRRLKTPDLEWPFSYVQVLIGEGVDPLESYMAISLQYVVHLASTSFLEGIRNIFLDAV